MDESQLFTVRLRIVGRVQGVFYRQSTREKARALRLTGWVSNENDGCVRVEASGKRRELEDLIAWCWSGPPSARVSHVEVEWQKLDDSDCHLKAAQAGGFQIRP